MEIGDRIKEYRKNKQITQQELAQKAGVSRVTLGFYERNQNKPPADVLGRIAQALEVTTDELLHGRIIADYKKMQEDENFLPFSDLHAKRTETAIFEGMKISITEAYDQLTPTGKVLLYKDAQKYLSTPKLLLNEDQKQLQKAAQVDLDEYFINEKAGDELRKISPIIGLIQKLYNMGYQENDILDTIEQMQNDKK